MVSVSFNPVGPWPIVIPLGVTVTTLIVWAYSYRMRGATGLWRYFALAFRLIAVLLCLIAAARPSVVFQEKKKEPASLLFLVDDSSSMKISDEVGGISRWDSARKTFAAARDFGKNAGDELTLKFYRFDKDLKEDKEGDPEEPTGRETSIGSSLVESTRRESGRQIASIFVFSDGSNNSGMSPQTAANQLKARNIPVITIGFGKNAGTASRDIAVRDLVIAPTVFVKNQIELKGTLIARGFANQTVQVEMLVDDQVEPVATKTMKIPDGIEQVAIAGLSYVPQTTGEKKVTLRVKPMEGEIVPTNNSISTFVTVLKGGLNVLYIQGPHTAWEYKFFNRAIASSPDIKAEPYVLRLPAQPNRGGLPSELLKPGRFDVFVLSDLPPNHMTAVQMRLMATAVEKGAGLLMLGGRSSFGMGGWGATPLASLLPTDMSPKDGEIVTESGIKFAPNPLAIENYLLQIGANREETATLWNQLSPLSGINRLGKLKDNANVLGYDAANSKEAIMVSREAGRGRSLAFGGETWIWARTAAGIPAHKKFWRQVIFWLSHKEDKGENEVKIVLDSRRVALGERLELGVTALDAKGNPISNVRYETKVEKEGDPPEKSGEKIELFAQGDQMRGEYATSQSVPGDYRVSVIATKDGKEIGRDTSRFLIYQDDLELENPSADRQLLNQLSESTGGKSLTPEEFPKYLESIKGKVFSVSVKETEQKIWDNWPFFLIFTTCLSLEWFIRKRHGWV